MKKFYEWVDNDFCMSETIRKLYGEGQEDETMEPIIRYKSPGYPMGVLSPGDSVIFYDIRGEREIQLTASLTDPSFKHFPVREGLNLHFTTMIEYDPGLKVNVAFPPMNQLDDSLCEVLSRAGLKQAKVVETEKSVHMSYFLNGKQKEPFQGEERFFVQSLQDVSRYDEYPGMCIEAVTEQVVKLVNDHEFDVIFCNFANVDVIGHIENEEAITMAVNMVDKHLGIVVQSGLKKGMHVIITADHGTVEKWLYPDGAIDTGHTDSEVPFIYIPPDKSILESIRIREKGALIDIAPTVLELFNIAKPNAMTGNSMFVNYTSKLLEKNVKLLFIILDGWGIAPESPGNLISKSNTPVMDDYVSSYPCSKLCASGEIVGMPKGSVGNSEAGHLHIGAGRTVFSDRSRIDIAFQNGEFHTNKTFLESIDNCLSSNATFHLLGIVSFYSSHGSLDHLFELMNVAKAKGVKSMMIHALLGRRGERPESGARYIKKVEEKCQDLGIGTVATVMGRFWALDREHNWNRIEKTYRALVRGEGIPVVNITD